MVQILPPKTSLGNTLGQALGSGLSSGMETGIQRGNLRSALSELENIPPDTTPGQLAQKIMFATAGIPGAERYVAPLYESLLADVSARQKAAPGVGVGLGGRGGPTMGVSGPPGSNVAPENARAPGAQFTKEDLQGLLGEKYFPNIQIQQPTDKPEGLRPQKPLVPPEPIGPSEEAKLRKQLRDEGVTHPAVLDDLINKAKNYQKEYYDAQKEGFNNVQEYQAARQERDKNFITEASPLLEAAHGTMTPNELSIWTELSRQYEELPNSQRYANTEQMYNTLVGTPISSFENEQRGLPVGSFFRPEEVKARIGEARSKVQDHLKRIEQRKDLSENTKGLIKNELREKYFTSMATKDFGVAQSAYATSNLSSNAAEAIPKAPPPKETIAETAYLSDPKQREKYTYDLANAFSKIGKDDSLLLMREKALANNYDDRAFNEALNLAISSGALELSDYQALERSKLSIPQRLDLDSIMDGKRNVYDLFKGKQ